MTNSRSQLADYIPDVTRAKSAFKGSIEILAEDFEGLLERLTEKDFDSDYDNHILFWFGVLETCEQVFNSFDPKARDNVSFSYWFWEALQQRLEDDHLRWGNTWEKRTIEGQASRCQQTFRNYLDQYENAPEANPVELTLKIAGNAFICSLRLVLRLRKMIEESGVG